LDSISDSTLTAWITDTLYANSIQGRDFRYKINLPRTIITNKTYQPRLSIGGFVGSGQVSSYGPSALYSDKQWTYSLSYDYYNKSLMAGVYYSIWKSKK
jgi:hypothetical protein